MKDDFSIFLKGMLMGICDLVPGISGGTIAFITGIYERLMNAIKGFSPKLITSNFKEEVKKLDLRFLIFLFLGIISSILLGARIIESLLENYYARTLSFFIGLIVASSFILFHNIKRHEVSEYLWGLMGLIIGFGLIFLSPNEMSISNAYLFLGGLIAISAMFLPGISGSFILLIMGLYEPILSMLGEISLNIYSLGVFILGMIFGAFVISRIIAYLFKKDKNKTLYFLLGLVIGALGVPVMKVYESMSSSDWIMIPGLFFIGALIVLIIGRYTN